VVVQQEEEEVEEAPARPASPFAGFFGAKQAPVQVGRVSACQGTESGKGVLVVLGLAALGECGGWWQMSQEKAVAGLASQICGFC